MPCCVFKAVPYKGSLCALCLCMHEPRRRCSNSVTPISVNLCFRLRPLIGQGLVTVLTETEDGQHVSPLLPPQRVSFVQRGELTERGERGCASHIQSNPSCVSTLAISVRMSLNSSQPSTPAVCLLCFWYISNLSVTRLHILVHSDLSKVHFLIILKALI